MVEVVRGKAEQQRLSAHHAPDVMETVHGPWAVVLF